MSKWKTRSNNRVGLNVIITFSQLQGNKFYKYARSPRLLLSSQIGSLDSLGRKKRCLPRPCKHAAISCSAAWRQEKWVHWPSCGEQSRLNQDKFTAVLQIQGCLQQHLPV